MSAAESAGTITVHPRPFEPSLSRWVATSDLDRRSAGATRAHRIFLPHPVGSDRRDVVATAGRDPSHARPHRPEPVVRTGVG